MKIEQIILDRIIARAIEIQQIPAPTFEEAERAEFIRAEFVREGLSDVHVDEIGNVYARLAGQRTGRPVVLSAHTDTVFPQGTDLTITKNNHQIAGPGIGDNSSGVAGLFGLLWVLKKQDLILPSDLWLVANVGEEGLGDLKGMRAVVERFGETPLAYIVLEGMALGRVFHSGLGVRRYRVIAETTGGHSWADYGRPNAIYALTDLIQKLRKIVLPTAPQTTLSVGIIRGGTSINTIPATASFELDLRSVGEESLRTLAETVEKFVIDGCEEDVNLRFEVIGDRPIGEIAIQHPLVQLAIQVLSDEGIAADLNVGSTDANIPLSMGLPAICIGLSLGGGAHTVDEYLRPSLLPTGMAQLMNLIQGVYDL